MHSSMISKIEKARAYSEQRDRVNITTLSATFRGNHNIHQVTYDDAGWHCSCAFSATHATCSHTMALQRILEGMIPEAAKLESL